MTPSQPSLPPVPGMRSSVEGGGGGGGSLAFSGGLPAMQTAIQQMEAGAQALAQQVPSLAPMVAQFITQLRMAIPGAISAAAGMGGQGGMSPPGLAPPAPGM